MSEKRDALLTFSIGPVHTFIAQARRVADLWAGSTLLSHLIKSAVNALRDGEGEMVFPVVGRNVPIPDGLPNRFVCRVPAARASEVAANMADAVRTEWEEQVSRAMRVLESHGIAPDSQTRDQTTKALEISWSYVPLDAGTTGYATASAKGARQFAASRMFRPFAQIDERLQKCAVCGERTALPDGDRSRVEKAWLKAETRSKGTSTEPFFRGDQSRLCLVCATKRLFPRILEVDGHPTGSRFSAFEEFEPRPGDEGAERKRYFAIVSMDGDYMGRILGCGPDEIHGADVEAFHRKVSQILTEFANSLRTASSSDLNLENLAPCVLQGRPPQLIYAGGEDVLFVCDPRDATHLAKLVREKYRTDFAAIKELLAKEADYRRFTISAAILIAHTKHPAGLLFREVEALLNDKAKKSAGRDAVAIRLAKRSGVPVETAFKWDEAPRDGKRPWIEELNALIAAVSSHSVASGQTFNLRTEERTLLTVFDDSPDLWRAWLTEQLSRGAGSAGRAPELAGLIAPFFSERKTEALRIARFLAVELPGAEGGRS